MFWPSIRLVKWTYDNLSLKLDVLEMDAMEIYHIMYASNYTFYK